MVTVPFLFTLAELAVFSDSSKAGLESSGENEGLFGLYDGLFGLYDGLLGLYEGLFGLYDGSLLCATETGLWKLAWNTLCS